MVGFRIAALAVLIWAVVGNPAFACSVFSDYVKPTNFELVQLADAIVVARAKSAEKGPDRSDTSVLFHVESALKGSTPADVKLAGYDLGSRTVSSDPDTLAEANREAYSGPCIRMTFKADKSYVLFLEHDTDGVWRAMGYPFSRVNEDYFGADSLWVRTIKMYAAVQAGFAPMDQLAEMERMLATKKAEPASRLRDIEAADILDHLQSRSPYKPTPYLISTYEALAKGEQPRFPLRSRQADAEGGAADALTNLVFGLPATRAEMDRWEQMEFVLTSLINGRHADARPFFEKLAANPQASVQEISASIEFFAFNEDVRNAFEMIETRALAKILVSDSNDALSLINAAFSAMDSKEYRGPGRWRSDPAAAARWPEMALRLTRQVQRLTGKSEASASADWLESLRPKDYRDRPEVTLLLAGAYDQDVEKWAAAELNDAAKEAAYRKLDEEADKTTGPWPASPFILPMQAMVSSSGDDRDALLVKQFCMGKSRRLVLFDALAEFADSLDDHLVARMLASKGLDAEEREELLRVPVEAYGRAKLPERLSGRRDWLSADTSVWFDMISALPAVDKGAKPIICPGK